MATTKDKMALIDAGYDEESMQAVLKMEADGLVVFEYDAEGDIEIVLTKKGQEAAKELQ